jgi:hypothetical protein
MDISNHSIKYLRSDCFENSLCIKAFLCWCIKGNEHLLYAYTIINKPEEFRSLERSCISLKQEEEPTLVLMHISKHASQNSCVMRSMAVSSRLLDIHSNLYLTLATVPPEGLIISKYCSGADQKAARMHLGIAVKPAISESLILIE